MDGDTGRPEALARDGRDVYLAAVPKERIHDLDVRRTLREGGEPFERIMEAVAALPRSHVLRIRAIFEPVPLYAVLGDLGFDRWTERLGAEDWRVWFFRELADPKMELPIMRRGDDMAASAGTDKETELTSEAVIGGYLLDVRRLGGPDKHPTIHRLFDALGSGQALTIVNDHNPKPLYYELCAEKPDRFDADNYRAYEADKRVWVAVLPVRLDAAGVENNAPSAG